MPRLTRAQPLLGTIVEITISTQQENKWLDTNLQTVIGIAFHHIKLIEQLMSFHNSQSELNKLHYYAHQSPIRVHPYTYAVLKRADRFFLESDGYFDCTIAKYLTQSELLPLHIKHLNFYTHQKNLLLLKNNTVFFKKPILLDLGGIAKGFAIDIAIYVLKKFGVKHAIVNAGGDLRVLGNISQPIYIRDPMQPQQSFYAGLLEEAAIATSGSYFESSFLVNPKTQIPINTLKSYSVIAPNACTADALTKVLAVTENPHHACFAKFGAKAFIYPS